MLFRSCAIDDCLDRRPSFYLTFFLRLSSSLPSNNHRQQTITVRPLGRDLLAGRARVSDGLRAEGGGQRRVRETSLYFLSFLMASIHRLPCSFLSPRSFIAHILPCLPLSLFLAKHNRTVIGVRCSDGVVLVRVRSKGLFQKQRRKPRR